MGKTTIPILYPGERVTLRAKLMLVDYDAMDKRGDKWWMVWRPTLLREATQEELKYLRTKLAPKAPKEEV